LKKKLEMAPRPPLPIDGGQEEDPPDSPKQPVANPHPLDIKQEPKDAEFEADISSIENLDESIFNHESKVVIKEEPLDIKPKIEPVSPPGWTKVFGKGAISHETAGSATPTLIPGELPVYDPKAYADENSENKMDETPTKDKLDKTEDSSRKKRKSGNDDDDETGNKNKKSGKLQHEQIALLQRLLQEEKSVSADLKRKLGTAESTITNVRKIFRDDQLNRLENPHSRGHWQDMTIQNSIQDFTRMGFTGYEHMRKRLQNAIPSAETLRWHLRKIGN